MVGSTASSHTVSLPHARGAYAPVKDGRGKAPRPLDMVGLSHSFPCESDVALAQIGVAGSQGDLKLELSRRAVEHRDKVRQRALQFRCAVVRSSRRPVADVDHDVLRYARI